MFSLKNKIRIKLPLKIVLSVVLVQALMLILIVVNSVRLINTSHATIMEQYINETNQLLAVSLQPGLIAHDVALINDVLSLLKDKHNLVYTSVYDRRGRLIAHHGESHRAIDRKNIKTDSSFNEALSDNVFDTSHEINLYGQKLGYLYTGYSIAQIREYSNKTTRQNTLLAIIGLTLSVLVSVFLGIVLSKNLNILEEGAHALERGQLSHRITLDSNDEINDVAQSFNKLALHLQKTQASLQDERTALEKEAHRLETLLNGVNAVLLDVDPDTNNFTYVSKRAQELLGFPVEK